MLVFVAYNYWVYLKYQTPVNRPVYYYHLHFRVSFVKSEEICLPDGPPTKSMHDPSSRLHYCYGYSNPR